MLKKYVFGLCLVLQLSALSDSKREMERWLQRLGYKNSSLFSESESQRFIEDMNADSALRTPRLENSNIMKNIFLAYGWNKTQVVLQSSQDAQKAWYSMLWAPRYKRLGALKK